MGNDTLIKDFNDLKNKYEGLIKIKLLDVFLF